MLFKKLTIGLFAAVLLILPASFGLPGGGGGVEVVANSAQAQLQNPINVDSPEALIGNVIGALLALSGTIALVMFVWGGILWLTSGGNPERIEKGKNTLIWAVAGLVLIFTAYALVRVVLQALTGASGVGA